MYVGAGNKDLFLSNLRKNPEEVLTEIGRGRFWNFVGRETNPRSFLGSVMFGSFCFRNVLILSGLSENLRDSGHCF